MVHFVIAGRADCPNYIQVKQTVAYLAKNLPCFEYRKVELSHDEWASYLLKINRDHGWHQNSSPLIYKEVNHYGTNTPVLIGGADEFWEYCYDYYGLENKLTQEQLEQMLKENMFWVNKETDEEAKALRGTFQMMIYGATNPITELLLPEFMKIKRVAERVKILLYDENLGAFDPGYFETFNEAFYDMFAIKSYYCDNLAEGIRETDLLVMVDDISNLTLEGNDSAFSNYLLQICFLVEEINMCAKRSLRIILANSGMTSFIATMMARKLSIPKSQIVVVSSDLGLGYLAELFQRIKVAPRYMCAPPVWGFVGTNEFVDVGSTLMKAKIYKPYPRALRATQGSTLVHGTIFCELRYVNYLTDGLTDLKESVDKRREAIRGKLQRPPILAKLEALINLITLWFSDSSPKSSIICLGIYSDGSFGIPEHLMFSQPSVLFRGGWIPYSNYPVPDHILEKIAQAGQEAKALYEKYSSGKIFKRATSRAQLKLRQSLNSPAYKTEMDPGNAAFDSKFSL